MIALGVGIDGSVDVTSRGKKMLGGGVMVCIAAETKLAVEVAPYPDRAIGRECVAG